MLDDDSLSSPEETLLSSPDEEPLPLRRSSSEEDSLLPSDDLPESLPVVELAVVDSPVVDPEELELELEL